MKFPYITQLNYCQNLDFEAGPNNKLKPLIRKTIFFDFKISKNSYITQLKYCIKSNFETIPNNELKPLIKKNYFFCFRNQLNFLYSPIKILPKNGFRSGIEIMSIFPTELAAESNS